VTYTHRPPFEELTESHRTWGSIYFSLWGVLMLLILANVFIAILSNAYEVVFAELRENDDEDMFKRAKKAARSLLEKLHLIQVCTFCVSHVSDHMIFLCGGASISMQTRMVKLIETNWHLRCHVTQKEQTRLSTNLIQTAMGC